MKRNATTELYNDETGKATEIDETTDNVLDFSSTLKELRKTVDPQLIRQRAGMRDRNGHVQMVEYVEWHTVADILDETAPNWVHSVKDIRPIGDIITVTVAITIDGITREGIGTGKAFTETGIKKAEHDALKRAAVKFGIARELYKKEFDSIDKDESEGTAEQSELADPVAKTIGDLLTAKQMGMIRAIGRTAEIDVDRECFQLLRCSIDELSRRAASELIDHLQDMQRNPAAAMRRAG